MRLLMVDNILTPYNVSFYAAMAQRRDVVARTLFLAANDTNRSWRVSEHELGFEHRVLRSLRAYVERLELPFYLHWGLWSELRRFRPDVVAICGYHYFATLEVLAFARVRRIPAVLWSGSHLRSGFVKQGWADAYKRWIVRRFDTYLTYGTASREQLIHHGAAPDRIVVGCNTVDVHSFKARADALRAPRAPEPTTRLLYVGRLVPLKNVTGLITAVGHLQQGGRAVSLTIVGDGAERQHLEGQVRRDAVREVRFAGFLAGDALVQAYVDADSLVLPSFNETWGLVVNEAAACGVPAVVSRLCGAAPDLIEEGKTGLTFDPALPGDLERALETMVRDPEARRRMGAAARVFILSRDPAYYASRLVEAAELALASAAAARA